MYMCFKFVWFCWSEVFAAMFMHCSEQRPSVDEISKSFLDFPLMQFCISVGGAEISWSLLLRLITQFFKPSVKPSIFPPNDLQDNKCFVKQ